MEIILIVAQSKNRVIGVDGDLPWRLPKDMAFFKSATLNHAILTGRKNYESIPAKFRPLKDRLNIVVTRQSDYPNDGIEVVNDIQSGIEVAKQHGFEQLFIIGGGQIYEQSLHLAHKMLITEVDVELNGDTFFPAFDASKWKKRVLAAYPADEKHPHSFNIVEYQRLG